MHPLIAIVSLLFFTISTAAAADFTRQRMTGRLIVEMQPDASSDTGLSALQGDYKSTNSTDVKKWAGSNDFKLLRGLSRGTHLVKPDDSGSSGNVASTEAALRYLANRLAASEAVLSASVEYRRFPLLEPNDPLYQGNVTEPGNQSYLYEGDYSLRAPGAWDITTGSQSAVIAVIDTGVLPDHPDLMNRSITGLGYDFVSPDKPGDFFSANDGDGRDADPSDPGDHCNAKPSSWHGTGVASVAAGSTNNAEGLAGVDWNARLLHARALGRCGGTDADIIDAIRWSAGLSVSGLPMNETPATVVNLSIGGPTECTTAWQKVIDELNGLGIPFVIAAGNESTNALRSSPANCANVITVGSNTPAGDLDSGFSNYGLKVTVAAPGRNILMATNEGIENVNPIGNDYKNETGSSFSAALVSGAISLMQSLDAELSPSAVRAILQQSASDFATDDECGTYYCGSGILNLVRAMQMTRDGGYNESINKEAQVISTQLTGLDFDTPVNGSLFGYRDIRYFEVNVADAGMLVVRSSSDDDLYGYLLDDNFSVLSLDDDSDSAFNFRVASLVEPGTYYVAVERAVNRRSDGESTFTLSTELTADQPDPFTFAPVNNAAMSTPVVSQTVEISGLSRTAIITVSGGSYSVNGNAYTKSQGQINNGDKVTVSLQSPAALNSSATLNLTVGAYATEFSVTTGNGVSPPDGSNGGSSASSRSGCSLNGQGSTDPILLCLLLGAAFALLRRRAVH